MKVLDKIAPHSHWLLRIALASVFLYHGISKLLDVNGFAHAMSFSFAVALLVALAETGGSLLILLGGFLWGWVTRLGALIQMPVMVGAIAMVHWGPWSGMEFQVTLLLIQLFFFLRGNDVKLSRATPA